MRYYKVYYMTNKGKKLIAVFNNLEDTLNYQQMFSTPTFYKKSKTR